MLSYLKGREIIHSIPLKKVYYKASDAHLTLEQFDGSISKTKTIFSTLIQQSVQYYEGKLFLKLCSTVLSNHKNRRKSHSRAGIVLSERFSENKKNDAKTWSKI
jgi:hypothetical protein